jgi:hypothetical protein
MQFLVHLTPLRQKMDELAPSPAITGLNKGFTMREFFELDSIRDISDRADTIKDIADEKSSSEEVRADRLQDEAKGN